MQSFTAFKLSRGLFVLFTFGFFLFGAPGIRICNALQQFARARFGCLGPGLSRGAPSGGRVCLTAVPLEPDRAGMSKAIPTSLSDELDFAGITADAPPPPDF